MIELTHSPNEAGWSFNDKWPAESGIGGYTMVPNTLLKHYQKLKLTPGEFLILVNIESFRWVVERLPFPSIEMLSKRTGMSERTVTRTISSLQNQRGVLIRYKRRGTSNQYSLDPLVEKLIEYEEEIETRYWQS
jgi:DNA-binding transcriptional ArsR family regulator